MSGADEALQRAVADACLAAETPGDLRAFLEARGVPAEDVEAIVSAPPWLAVYRSLVRNGLTAVARRLLPRTRARIDAARGAGAFEQDFAAFLDRAGPRTHYLRDVPFELVAWATPRWRADARLPPWLGDLAAHELTAFAVAASAPARAPERPAELGLDRSLLFATSMRLARHDWAIHELPAGEGGACAEPDRREVHLLAYRDAAHAVRWLELTPLAAAVIERLAIGEPLGAAVERACAAHGAAPALALPQIAALLADLGERGVLLGARAG